MSSLHFIYRDRDGVESEVKLFRWVDHPTYILGFKDLSWEPRSYSKRRILEWIEDPIDIFRPYQAEEPPARIRHKPEIIFTGFATSDRAILETRALMAGFTVRKVVSKGLDVLVVGDKPGWAKLEKAQAQGVAIITRGDCEALFSDGVLP